MFDALEVCNSYTVAWTDRSAECAHAKSIDRAISAIGVNIGVMPYVPGLGWMPYRRLWGNCPTDIPDPNRFWVGVPPCISRHLPRRGKPIWIRQRGNVGDVGKTSQREGNVFSVRESTGERVGEEWV